MRSPQILWKLISGLSVVAVLLSVPETQAQNNEQQASFQLKQAPSYVSNMHRQGHDLQQRLHEVVHHVLTEQNSTVRLLSLRFDGRSLTLDFSTEVLLVQGTTGFEDLMRSINNRINDVLEVAGLSNQRSFDYVILSAGQRLGPLPKVPERRYKIEQLPTTKSITGKKISINPGHGWYTTSNGNWALQRPWLSGIVEDFINVDLAIELDTKLTGLGAQTLATRNLNKLAGNHES